MQNPNLSALWDYLHLFKSWKGMVGVCEPGMSGQDCPPDGKRGAEQPGAPGEDSAGGRTRLWWRGEGGIKDHLLLRLFFFPNFFPFCLTSLHKIWSLLCLFLFLFCALKLANEFGTVSPEPLGYYPFPSEAAITLTILDDLFF